MRTSVDGGAPAPANAAILLGELSAKATAGTTQTPEDGQDGPTQTAEVVKISAAQALAPPGVEASTTSSEDKEIEVEAERASSGAGPISLVLNPVMIPQAAQAAGPQLAGRATGDVAARGGATNRAMSVNGAPSADIGPIDVLKTAALDASGQTAGPTDATSKPTFGEHLASIGMENVADSGQGRPETTSAVARVDMAQSAVTLPPGIGAPSATGTAARPASMPAHPVVSGVPITAVPVEIGMKSLAGINRFDIRLDPDDLGQIDVRLDILDEGRVRAHIVVERPEALVALQRDTSHLERALEQAGFRTSDDGVSLSLRQEGQGQTGSERGDGRESPAQPSHRRDQSDSVPLENVRRYAWGRASGVDRHI